MAENGEANNISKWEAKREAQMREAGARVSKLKLAFGVAVYLVLARKVLELSLASILKLTLASLGIAAAASLKPAPAVRNKNLVTLYKHYPVLGGVEWVFHAILECPVQQQFDEAKKTNFTASELCLLGGTRDLYIFERSDIEYVLKDNWRNFTKNAEGGLGFLDYFAEILGRGIFAVDWDDGEWQAHRKTASYMFSNSALTTKMEISFNKHGDALVELLRAKAEAGKSFNIQEAMQALTFDAICDIAFGVDPGALEASLSKNERIDFLVRFDRLQQNIINRFMMPGPVWQFLRRLNLFYEAKIEEDAKQLRLYVQKIIETRKQDANAASNGDLLSLYIESAKKSPDRAHLQDDDYLSDMVLNFAIAGRDTTSCTLTNLMLELGLDAENAKKAGRKSAADKMREEFNDVVGANRSVSMTDVKNLRYCCAVFNEVLRLHPPVAIDGRVCREEDVLPSGIQVPRNTFVWVPNSAIGRDPSRWERPNEFVPERWLEAAAEGESVRRVDEYLHPVFWGGPRLCIGKDAARLEVLCVAKAFLHHYDVALAEDNNARIAPAPVQFYEKGLWGKVIRRS